MQFKFKVLTVLSLLLSGQVLLAKPLNLYEHPKADSLVLGSIDSDAGFIPIFTPKDNKEWVKVADPKNGNVGWLKQKDLKNTGITFTQQILSTQKGVNAYQVTSAGGLQPLSAEQTQAMMKHFQQSQHQMQKAVKEMMDAFSMPDLPFIMPVIITPEVKNKR